MSYTVRQPSDLTALGQRLRALDYKHPWVVTWKPESQVRTDKQNRRYWAGVVGSLVDWLAMPENGGRRVSRELAHQYLKLEILGGDTDVINGRVVTVERRTRDMDKAAFAEYVDAAEAHIIDLGVPAEMIAGVDA